MQLLPGTSGFSYKEWKGSFYPEDAKPADWLRYYAQHLPAVEINNSFYRMPAPQVLEGWAAEVPSSFQFVIKSPRQITHFRRLRDVEEPLADLQKSLELLGSSQGPVLFQLPPKMPKDLPRLQNDGIAYGEQALAGALPAHESVLLVSGRASFEIVQKAAAAGIPILCAVSAASDLAISTAERVGMTLVGFLRGSGFNVYSDAERIDLDG